MKPSDLMRWAEERGWIKYREGKGSHVLYRFPSTNAVMVIPRCFSDQGRRVMNMMQRMKKKERA